MEWPDRANISVVCSVAARTPDLAGSPGLTGQRLTRDFLRDSLLPRDSFVIIITYLVILIDINPFGLLMINIK